VQLLHDAGLYIGHTSSTLLANPPHQRHLLCVSRAAARGCVTASRASDPRENGAAVTVVQFSRLRPITLRSQHLPLFVNPRTTSAAPHSSALSSFRAAQTHNWKHNSSRPATRLPVAKRLRAAAAVSFWAPPPNRAPGEASAPRMVECVQPGGWKPRAAAGAAHAAGAHQGAHVVGMVLPRQWAIRRRCVAKRMRLMWLGCLWRQPALLEPVRQCTIKSTSAWAADDKRRLRCRFAPPAGTAAALPHPQPPNMPRTTSLALAVLMVLAAAQAASAARLWLPDAHHSVSASRQPGRSDVDARLRVLLQEIESQLEPVAAAPRLQQAQQVRLCGADATSSLLSVVPATAQHGPLPFAHRPHAPPLPQYAGCRSMSPQAARVPPHQGPMAATASPLLGRMAATAAAVRPAAPRAAASCSPPR
jgi:hypothetical protein